MSSYVFIFHQLADVLKELPAYLNKNHVDNMEYILACYQSQIDGFDTSITTQGINIAHNTEKHWRNLVRADAEQVANHIAANKDDDVDTNDEDEDKDGDSDDEE